MPAKQAARLLARGLRAPVDGETATALFEKFDRMAVDLALVSLMLDGEVVVRANVDPAQKGRWLYRTVENDAEVQADLPRHDDVSPQQWGR
jgi:hypothetical protein